MQAQSLGVFARGPYHERLFHPRCRCASRSPEAITQRVSCGISGRTHSGVRGLWRRHQLDERAYHVFCLDQPDGPRHDWAALVRGTNAVAVRHSHDRAHWREHFLPHHDRCHRRCDNRRLGSINQQRRTNDDHGADDQHRRIDNQHR